MGHDDDDTVQVIVYLPRWQREQLRERAKADDLSMSWVVRRALSLYMGEIHTVIQ